jgi:glycosyltransferase involved in cell wall biosynthesis
MADLGVSVTTGERARSRGPAVDPKIDGQAEPNRDRPAPSAPGRPVHSPGHILLMFQPVFAGVPNVVADLAEGLAARGWRVSVAAPSTTPVRERLEAIADNYIVLDTSNGPKPGPDVRAYRALARLCRTAHVDVVHAHSSKAGALSAMLTRMSDIPVIYSPHAWSFQRDLSSVERRIWAAVERLVTSQQAGIVVNCAAERVAAQDVGIRTPIATVSHGLRDVQPVGRVVARDRLSLDRELFTIGWIGRDARQKRPEHLAAIARRLGSSAAVVAFGYGMPESEAGAELTAAGATVFPAQDPQDLYSAVDVLAITSRWEGSPLTVLEAMRAGRPVVAYDVGGLAEQVEDGVTGYLVPAGDVDDMVMRLRQLAADPLLAARMGESGRAAYADRFTLDRMLDGAEVVYRQHISVMQVT